MKYNPVTEDQIIFEADNMPSMRSISFNSNGSKLIGSFYLPYKKGIFPTIVLLHGFPGNEHNQDLAHSLRRAGHNVLIFHYRGTWGSEGSFSFSNAVEDVRASYNFVTDKKNVELYNIDTDNIFYIGHSIGGFLSFINAEKLKLVKKIAFIAGFNLGLMGKVVSNNLEMQQTALDYLENGCNMVKGATPKNLLSEIIANKNEFDLLDKISFLQEKDVLLVGAKYDTTAQPELHHFPIKEAFATHTSFKEFFLNSGHVFSNKRIELANTLINWLEHK